jgi:hypothetical protein
MLDGQTGAEPEDSRPAVRYCEEHVEQRRSRVFDRLKCQTVLPGALSAYSLTFIRPSWHRIDRSIRSYVKECSSFGDKDIAPHAKQSCLGPEGIGLRREYVPFNTNFCKFRFVRRSMFMEV